MSNLSNTLRQAGLVICIISGVFLAQVAPAQTTRFSPEQQQLLDQLSPAQREQALQALRQRDGSATETAGTSTPPLSPVVAAAPVGEVVRGSPGSRLIIDFRPKDSLSDKDREDLRIDPVLSQLVGSRTFELDDNGMLSLLGLESVPLLGLTEDDIERRLRTEPLLAQFDLDASILQSSLTGAEALQPFGYGLFESREAGFDPPMAGPVPPDYVMGPGDTVRVQLFGNTNGTYDVGVSRDGILNLPEIGPVTAAGLPFSEFRADVNRRVGEMLIGTQVSVTMGQLRTIRVFVLGDGNRPGSYVVDSLATISSALYRSGGISRAGSVRDIQLKRQGRTVARLDLYDLLLDGDTSGDSRLQPGDVIFIAPIGAQVAVSGAVRRPAVYETKSGEDLADVVAMAGGLLPEAYPKGARIERIETGDKRVVVAVDASNKASANTRVQAGDVLVIPSVLPELAEIVTLSGHVHRPGPYQWRPGMRLTDLIGSALEVKPGGDLNYVLIRREDARDRSISVLSANLAAALATKASTDNILLTPRDTLYVFNMAFGRQRIIEPILSELNLQSRIDEPFSEVSVTGQVKAPGSYPLEEGMRVSDLIRAGGDLSEQAYTLKAEIARYEVLGGESRHTQVVDVDLAAILRGDQSADRLLNEHDNLRISRVPAWDSPATVVLQGEITFPGSYRIRRGETLRELLTRAGGLTDAAFAEGAVFLRDSLRDREQEQLDMLATRLESDLISLSLEKNDEGGEETLATGSTLLAQLRATPAVGRLVIDLKRLQDAGGNFDAVGDLELRDGDQLLVPQKSQEVSVIGEVQQSASHLYQAEISQKDYIQMSGGMTRRADKSLVYVVRASGAVVTGNRSRWFGRAGDIEIFPGDTIVVPIEIDRVRTLTFWGSVTQILYQGAIAVAAIRSFD